MILLFAFVFIYVLVKADGVAYITLNLLCRKQIYSSVMHVFLKLQFRNRF